MTEHAHSGPCTLSALGETVLTRMRAEAAAEAGPFVDPRLLREAQTALPGTGQAWLERVVGHPLGSTRALTGAEVLLTVRAAQAGAAHLQALTRQRRIGQELAQQRAAAAAAAARQTRRQAWEARRARISNQGGSAAAARAGQTAGSGPVRVARPGHLGQQ
jgi:hypothetical protein